MRPDDVCDVNFQEIYVKNRTPDDVCDVNFQEIFLIFIYLEMTDNQFNDENNNNNETESIEEQTNLIQYESNENKNEFIMNDRTEELAQKQYLKCKGETIP